MDTSATLQKPNLNICIKRQFLSILWSLYKNVTIKIRGYWLLDDELRSHCPIISVENREINFVRKWCYHKHQVQLSESKLSVGASLVGIDVYWKHIPKILLLSVLFEKIIIIFSYYLYKLPSIKTGFDAWFHCFMSMLRNLHIPIRHFCGSLIIWKMKRAA